MNLNFQCFNKCCDTLALNCRKKNNNDNNTYSCCCCCQSGCASLFPCCCSDPETDKEQAKNKPRTPSEQIVYLDQASRIVIISTPATHTDVLADIKDLDHSDIVLFSKLGQHITILGGNYPQLESLCQAHADIKHHHHRDSHDSPDSNEPNDQKDTPPKNKNKDKSILLGQTLKDKLPPPVADFLLPIYEQTLKGDYIQVTLWWLQETHLLRTFPILGPDDQIMGGLAVSMPYRANISENISAMVMPRSPKSSFSSPNPNPDPPPNHLQIDEPKPMKLNKSSNELVGLKITNRNIDRLLEQDHPGILPSAFARRSGHQFTD